MVGMAQTVDGEILLGLPDEVAAGLRRGLGSKVLELVSRMGGSAKPGNAVLIPGPDGLRLVVVGMGPLDVTAEQVRRAAGVGLRLAGALPGSAPHKVTISLQISEPDLIKGAAEGALLGSYSYRPEKPDRPGVGQVVLISPNRRPEARQALDLARVTAAAVVQARNWVNTPGNQLYPESFVEQLRPLARDAKLDLEVWDEKALAREGFGGLLAVGSGSVRPPRLVKLSYSPRGAKAHLALVGKGITFDAGGLTLKPLDGMYTMKADMAGAAAVLAATAAIAELGLRVRVTAWAGLAENLPSGSAYRPSDVLTMYGDRTVENGNSDAEGRLVLADALSRCVEEAPTLVLDVATLTGACVVALGERVGGLMARDDLTADLILDAAGAAGEQFWHLPIPEDARPKLDSRVADLKSTGDKHGGALSAAAFLSEFVPPELPWAHLDIAGPAFNTGTAYDYTPAGGTGVAVRTLIAIAHGMAG